MRPLIPSFISAICLFATATGATLTATFDNGGGDHLWLNAANWDPDGVPQNTAADKYVVTIPGTLAAPAILDSGRTIDRLIVASGAILDLEKTGIFLAVQGDVTNNGLIRLDGAGNQRLVFDERNDAPVSFLGSGTFQMNHPFDLIQSTINQHLTNGPAHTIEGTGQIGSNAMTIVNEGAIVANLAGLDLAIDPFDTFLNDGGTVRVENGASLTLKAAAYSAANGGSFEIADNSELILEGAIISNLTFAPDDQDADLSNNRVRALLSNPTLSTGAVNEATLVFNPNQVLTIADDVVNNGVIDLTGGGDLFLNDPVDSDLTLSGSGSVILNGSLTDNIGGTIGHHFTHGAAHTVRGTGLLGLNRLNFVHRGLIEADVNGETFLIDPLATFHNDGGTITASNGGTVEFAPGTYSGANGGRYLVKDDGALHFDRVTITGGTFAADDQDNDLSNNTPTWTNDVTFSGITNEGFLDVPASGTFRIASDITNHGLITIADQRNLILVGSPNNQALGFVGSGRVEVGSTPLDVSFGGSGFLHNGPGHTLQTGDITGAFLPAPANITTIVNEGTLEWTGGGKTLQITQAGGVFDATNAYLLGSTDGDLTLSVTINGGEFLSSAQSSDVALQMSETTTFKVRGDQIGESDFQPGSGQFMVGESFASSVLLLGGTLELQLASAGSFDRLNVTGDLSFGSGGGLSTLSLNLAGPASGFSSSSVLEIVAVSSYTFATPSGPNDGIAGGPGFFGFSNVTSGSRLTTSDGLASFVVTTSTTSTAFEETGSITLSSPLFAPEFTAAPYAFSIPAGSPVATPVGTVNALDPESGTVTYNLSSGSPFTIHPTTGAITVVDAAGVASSGQFNVLVTATDGSLSNTSNASITVGTVSVTNETCVRELLSQAGGAFEGVNDPAIIGANADPDGDGLTNIFEVWLGSDPSATADLPDLTINNGPYATMEVTVPSAIDDTLAVGAEFSFDLLTFRPAIREMLSDNGTTRRLRFRDTVPAPDHRAFGHFTADLNGVK